MNFRKNYADRKANMSFSVAEWTDIVLALAIVSSDTEVKEERQKDFLNLAKKSMPISRILVTRLLENWRIKDVSRKI